jgi:hypothetical protein
VGAFGKAIAACCAAIAIADGASTNGAQAQVRQPPAEAPCSALSGRPCHPSFCGVFHRGPCFPEYLPPLGEDLRVTFISTDENGTISQPSGNAGTGNANTGADASDQKVDSIMAMFAALRACWVPPPKEQARHGMQYTIRFAFKSDGEIIAPPWRTYSSRDAPADVRDLYGAAIDAALKRCAPLPFSKGMGEAIAGRPIVIRFVDDRTIDNTKSQQ